jgi:hypothetical protein
MSGFPQIATSEKRTISVLRIMLVVNLFAVGLLFAALLGVQKRVVEGQMRFFRVAGILEVPEQWQVAQLGRFGRDRLRLTVDRGLADPASPQQPRAFSGALEDVQQMGPTPVEPFATNPLPK